MSATGRELGHSHLLHGTLDFLYAHKDVDEDTFWEKS